MTGVEVKDLIPENRLTVFVSIERIDRLITIGKENLKVMIKKWQNEADEIDRAIKTIDAYLLSTVGNERDILFALLLEGIKGLVVSIDKDDYRITEGLCILKESLSLKLKELMEKISVLSNLAQKAKSKPVFPFYREPDYVVDNEIYLLKKIPLRKPDWFKVEVELVAGMGVFGSFGAVKIESKVYDYHYPNLVSKDDLKYLKKNRDYATIWLESTKDIMNHKKRHMLAYSFK